MSSSLSVPKKTKSPDERRATGNDLWQKVQAAQTDAHRPDAKARAIAKDKADFEVFKERFYYQCNSQEKRQTPSGKQYTVNMMNAQPKSTGAGALPAFRNGIDDTGKTLVAFSNDKQGGQQPHWSLMINALLGQYNGFKCYGYDEMNFDALGKVRVVVREKISNNIWLDAAKAVATPRGLANKDVWFEIRPDENDDFCTMLGTPNGSGTARLLIDYAFKFKGITIDKIKVNHSLKEMRIILKEISQESAQGPAPKAVQVSAQKPIQKPAQNSAQKTGAKPAQGSAAKAAQKPGAKPAQRSAARSAQKPAHKPGRKT